jgi:hypothetical protein
MTIIYSTESAAIRYYHSRPHLLSLRNRHYCERPLLTILKGAPASWRRWLMRVRQARANYIKDGRLQTRMTEHFNRRSVQHTTADTQPATNQDVHTNDTNRRVSKSNRRQHQFRRTRTQEVITSFFPSARPPDLLASPTSALTSITKIPRSRY